MVSIGSLYHLIPKVFGREKMYSLGLINAHFWLATIGTVLYIASMWVNGITQGLMWRAGGVLQSRGDLSLDAGRDVTVAAVEDRQGQTRWNTSRLQSVTQLGAEVSAGRDLNVSAGRDLSAVASALEARRDIALSAGRDVTLATDIRLPAVAIQQRLERGQQQHETTGAFTLGQGSHGLDQFPR